MEHASSVDIGARKRRSDGINEDSVASAVLENHHRGTGRSVGVFVLADGVGGEASGDVASFLVTSIVRKRLTEHLQGSATDVLERFDVDAYPADPPTADEDARAALAEGRIRNVVQDAIDAAHRQIQQYAAAIGGQPATTVVAAVYADGKLHYGWVGDSRLYVVNTKHGEIRQLTEDHAVTNVRLKRGEIADEEYARVHRDASAITNAVGGSSNGKPTVDVEFGTATVFAEDVVVLTSDGLIDAYPDVKPLRKEYERAEDTDAVREKIRETLVTEDEIRDLVLDADDLRTAVSDLVEFANERGGKDNISIALARDPTARPTPDSVVSRAQTVVEPADAGGNGDAGDEGAGDEDGSAGDEDAKERSDDQDGTDDPGEPADDAESTGASGNEVDAQATAAAGSDPTDTGESSQPGTEGAEADGDATPSPDASPAESNERDDGVDVVPLGGDGPTTGALAIPGEETVYEIRGDVSVGRDAGGSDGPDLPLDVTTDAHVERVHALVTFDEAEGEWRVTDRSTSGTHVEVNEGEWLLLLSEEGLDRHRESGFDPDAATDRTIEQETTLEDGTAFVVEDPRHDDAVTCRFFTSVGRARERVADDAVRDGKFERFLM